MGGFFGVASKEDCVFDLFFGTDYPMWKPDEELRRFLRLPLTAQEQEKILHLNFEAFLAQLD